ncbi:MAG: hypothetical protein KDA60_03085 [Planctomycetales bacterium]|nr:hypothetical protein [Planctomycetales bacterium]
MMHATCLGRSLLRTPKAALTIRRQIRLHCESLEKRHLLSAVPQTIPYFEDFDDPNAADVAGWTFLPHDGFVGTRYQSSDNENGYSLAFENTRRTTGSNDAILALDLSDQQKVTDLVLEMRISTERPYSAYRLDIAISGDGHTWVESASIQPVESDHFHVDFDLDQMMLDAGIVPDEDVSLRFQHIANSPTSNEFLIDDVSISRHEDVTPRVASQRMLFDEDGRASGLELDFNKPVQGVTATTVSLRGPIDGGRIEFVGEPITLSDGRSYQLEFARQIAFPGNYQVTVDRSIADLAGRPLNAAAETPLGSSFQAYLPIPTALPVTAPYFEDFSEPTLAYVSGWTFSDASTFRVLNGELRQTRASRQGGLFLDLNLGTLAGHDDIVLDFDVSHVVAEPDAAATLALSADRESWQDIYTFPVDADNEHYVFDLDQELYRLGINPQGPIFVKFVGPSQLPSGIGKFTLDNVRVSRQVAGKPFVTSWSGDVAKGNQFTGLHVAFSEEVTLPPGSITVTRPDGTPIDLASITPDDDRNQSFAIELASPQTTAGIYHIRIDQQVADVDGNPLGPYDSEGIGRSTDFTTSFVLGGTAVSPGYVDNFEPGESTWDDRWSLFSSAGDVIVGPSLEVGAESDYRLLFDQPGQIGQQEALIRVAVDDPSDFEQLNLQFDTWADNDLPSGLLVSVSLDGTHWAPARSFDLSSQQQTNVLHLGRELREYPPTPVGSFLLRFQSDASASTGTVSRIELDNVNLTHVDVSGPVVESIELPDEQGRLVLTFSESVQTPAPTALQLRDVFQQVVPLVGELIDLGEGKTFAISVEHADQLSGEYTLTVSSEVQDAEGNFLNQVHPRQPVGAYVELIELPVVAAHIPSSTDFENAVPIGWRIESDDGTVEIAETSDDPSTSQLVFDLTNRRGTQDAILEVDLSEYSRKLPLSLAFRITRLAPLVSYSQTALQVSLSNDGQNWGTARSISIQGEPQWRQYDVWEWLSDAGIEPNNRLWIRFQHDSSHAAKVGLDEVQVTGGDVIGPYVESLAPAIADAPFSEFVITFNEPIQGLSAGQVKLVDPLWRELLLTDDHVIQMSERDYRIRLPETLTVTGAYSVELSDEIADLLGNRLNPRQADRNGLPFVGKLGVLPASHPVPYVLNLDGESPETVGWAFDTQGGPVSVVPTSDGTSLSFGVGTADLAVDLGEVTDPESLVLAFHASAGYNSRMSLEVSGDGTEWFSLDDITVPSGTYRLLLADRLAGFGIALDGELYLRFANRSRYTSDLISLNNVQVTTADLIGPKVQDVLAVYNSEATLAAIEIQFDEPVRSLTANQLRVFDAGFRSLRVTEPPVDLGEGRRYRVVLAEAPSFEGDVYVGLYSSVADLAGNPIRAAGDPAELVSVSVPLTSVSIPYVQGFDVGPGSTLSGWTATRDYGRIVVTEGAETPSGTSQIQFIDVGGIGHQEIRLKLDLVDQTNNDSMVLSFQAQSDYPAYVEVSGGGVSWYPVEEIDTDGRVRQYSYDFDQLLNDARIDTDDDVFLRLRRDTGLDGYRRTLTFDALRIDGHEPHGPRVVAIETLDEYVPLSGVLVKFSEPVTGFDPSTIRIFDPQGQSLPLAGPPVNLGDGSLYQINLSSPSGVVGAYEIVIDGVIVDLDGDFLDQDSTSPAGEVVRMHVAVHPPALVYPWQEDFESTNLTLSWQLSEGVSQGSFLESSGQRLVFEPRGEAIFYTDLSAAADRPDVELDFWLQAEAFDRWITLTVTASNDGVQWQQLAEIVARQDQTHVHLDLDQDLVANGLVLSDGMFFKMQASARDDTRLAIDEVRVSSQDVVGPHIVGLRPGKTIQGGFQFVLVEFSEPVQLPRTGDLWVLAPGGSRVPLVDTPDWVHGDRTYRVRLARPQFLGGTYTVIVSEHVKDLAGNELNADRDHEDGEANYAWHVSMAPRILPVPYDQSFELGHVGDLAGWAVSSDNSGTVDVRKNSEAPTGTRYLLLEDNSFSRQVTVQWVFDLAGYDAGQGMELSFMTRADMADRDGTLVVRAGNNGVSWPITTTTEASREWQHVRISLDSLLKTSQGVPHERLYVRIIQDATEATGFQRVQVDDVRVGPPPIVETTYDVSLAVSSIQPGSVPPAPLTGARAPLATAESENRALVETTVAKLPQLPDPHPAGVSSSLAVVRLSQGRASNPRVENPVTGDWIASWSHVWALYGRRAWGLHDAD